MTQFYWFSSDLLSLGAMYLVVSKSSEFDVKVSGDIIFTFCNIKIVGYFKLCFHFSLAVLGSIGYKLRFTNPRKYCSKSEFYDVFKQDKRPRLVLKRVFSCIC